MLAEAVRPIEVLLVEDDEGDVLMAAALPRGEGVQPPQRGRRRRRGGKVVSAPVRQLRRVRPDLVLLDLNLPKRDGRQVLEDIKSDPDLRRIPIVVLTTSEAEEDVLRSRPPTPTPT